jgi:hypothetical protein
MTWDLSAMVQIHQKLFVSMVTEAHGAAGGETLRKLLEFIRAFYQYSPPDVRTAPLVMFKTLDDREIGLSPAPNRLDSLSGISQYTAGPVAIQTFTSGHVIVHHTVTDPEVLASDAVVYQYQDKQESFHAKGKKALVDKLSPAYPSNFAIPTFVDLRLALDRYRTTMIRHSSCLIFQGCWHDHERIFFVSGPESRMRDSLTQFLKTCLRGDVEVRPEQIVDDSHPVDIKVTWFMSNRLALIEIKWLGKSRTETKITATYGESRARKGAKQLADYLDKNKQQSPLQDTRGYLVIIDGRRARTNLSTVGLSREHGMKYSDAVLRFNPQFHKRRDDFEPPFCMFTEPLVS